jgi:hypothetical protein
VLEILLPLGKTAAETATMLQEAFKDEAMGKTQVHMWFNCFKGVKCLLKTNHIVPVLL